MVLIKMGQVRRGQNETRRAYVVSALQQLLTSRFCIMIDRLQHLEGTAAVAYLGFHEGGCLIVRAQSAREKFMTTPTIGCAIL